MEIRTTLRKTRSARTILLLLWLAGFTRLRNVDEVMHFKKRIFAWSLQVWVQPFAGLSNPCFSYVFPNTRQPRTAVTRWPIVGYVFEKEKHENEKDASQKEGPQDPGSAGQTGSIEAPGHPGQDPG